MRHLWRKHCGTVDCILELFMATWHLRRQFSVISECECPKNNNLPSSRHVVTVTMDPASLVLARPRPEGVPNSYRALADHTSVPCSTFHHRARSRQSMRAKAERQQYLTPPEEQAVVEFLLHMSKLGQPVRMKHVPSIAFSATRHRCAANRPRKPPGKNWAKAFENRHPELRAKRVAALDWNRHENNAYEKIEDWFVKIQPVLKDPAVLAENVYNMDETGIMLSMLGSVKVLVR